MTEEEASHQRKERTERTEELARKDQRIEELEGLLTSALLRMEEGEPEEEQAPSSESFTRHGKKREASRKTKGGQAGHIGHTLERAETPDQVVIHRPKHCEACQCALGAAVGQITERRHIHERPVLRLEGTEQHVESLTCPRCQHHTVGIFSNDVSARPSMDPECKLWLSLCRRIDGCRWSAWARSSVICARVRSLKGRWRTGYRKPPARWCRRCRPSRAC